MKVLFLASEMAPFVKSGGLGDIIGSLPKALALKGIEVSVFIPKYNSINKDLLKNIEFICSTNVLVGGVTRNASIYKLTENDIDIYFVENEHYFNRYGIYGFIDDIERFSFFNRASLCSIEFIGFKPDIIHLNDWQTGIAPLYLQEKYSTYPFYKNIKTLFTIHNIQYQGVFPEDRFYTLGLSRDSWHPDGSEFYNNVNFLKAGLNYSNAISTVSRTYAKEIMTPEFGYGLDGVIRNRSKDTYGILNGVDYEDLKADSEKALGTSEGRDFFELKAERKANLQRHFGLPERDVPIYAIVSRLAEQKGLDLLSEYALHKDAQFIVLGTGEGRLEQKFLHFQDSFPDKFRACINFDVNLSFKIYAGSDFFIMPSLFEPCGLGQIYAMFFGTAPIVRNTGGLADTVQHFNPQDGTGNGFVFNDFVQSGLDWAIDESFKVYQNKEQMRQIAENALKSDFSWEKSADDYISLYKKILES